MLQLGDGTICYTRSQAEELALTLPGHPVWSAGNSCVTREQCEAGDAPAAAGCVTYVGRLVKNKKPAFLLEAFARAGDRLPPTAKLLLIGDGGEWVTLKARVKELGLSNRVEMPGHIAGEAELKKIYGRSMVSVSPGYVGLSAIQSMAFGVPMLVSRKEPHSPEIEACIEGTTSAFFETGNVDDLANKLVAFFAPDSSWQMKRQKISHFISENYTFDGMVETFTNAIEEASAQRTGRAEAADPAVREKVAVIWAQFGPYHLARLRALREKFGPSSVLGVEIGSRTSTYNWQRAADSMSALTTLLPGQTAESASGVDIYRTALRLFLHNGIEIVFVPSYWPVSSLAILLAARSAGTRIVMMNDSHARTAKARGIWAEVKRRLVLRFDAALVAGAPQKDYFTGMGLPAAKIVTGYDVVDNHFFIAKAAEARGCRDVVRARHGLPGRYFLNVGRMVWKKNLESLIDAYKRVKDRLGGDCPALVLVGSGKLERSLRERCLSLGLSTYQVAAEAPTARPGGADVYFLGFRQVDELPEIYALAECFILPSREEEWGLVVNEAMACGLPVLVSKVAGCARDLVRHGENGFLFEPFSTEELAGHLETIVHNPERAQGMGKLSQQIIADWGCERFAAAAKQAVEIALTTK